MKITNVSQLSGKKHTRDIPVTEEQIAAWKASGAFIQDALAFLSDDDREFLLTGITPDEWDAALGEDDA